MTTLENITNQMTALENVIAKQQQYILKHGESNDLNSDKQWEEYKEGAQENLNKWDSLKQMRDELKC